MRILIIDDDADIRIIVGLALGMDGFLVFEAGTGREGIEQALTTKPDVILLDRVLPDLEGLAVLTALRTHQALVETPVILMTARTDAAKDLGTAIGVIAKPFDPLTLGQRIRDHLAP